MRGPRGRRRPTPVGCRAAMELLLIRHALPVRIDDDDGPADPRAERRGLAAGRRAGRLAGATRRSTPCTPARCAGRRRRRRRSAARSASTCAIVDGLAEFDRDAHWYIPIEELKAADDPRWHAMVAWASGIDDPTEFQRSGRRGRRRDHRRPPGARRSPSSATAGSINAYAGTSSAAGSCSSSPDYTASAGSCVARRAPLPGQPQRDRAPRRRVRASTASEEPLVWSASNEHRRHRALGCPSSRPVSAGQLRGTSLQGRSLSTRTSPGRPSTRSPRMLRMISEVPPSMELARARRNAFCGPSATMAVSGAVIS